MKRINLACLAAALFLGLVYVSGADSPADANTNALATRFYFVAGDGVLTPGRFVYHEGVTITNAIRLAGGFSRWARKSRVEVTRNGQYPALLVDISKIETGQATNVTINPDDRIFVRGATIIQRRWYDQLRP